jgi:hypothetical protein
MGEFLCACFGTFTLARYNSGSLLIVSGTRMTAFAMLSVVAHRVVRLNMVVFILLA